MRKLLISTALVGSLIAGSAFAETKISGKLEATYGDKQTAAASAQKYNGANIGYDYSLNVTSSAQLTNGMTSKVSVTAVSDGANDGSGGFGNFQDGGLFLTSGNTTFYIGKDGMAAVDSIVNPKVYAIPEDNVKSFTNGNTAEGAVEDNNAIGIQQKISGGALTFLYVPQVGEGTDNGDNSSGGGLGSAYEIGYTGKISGVEVHIGHANTKKALDTSTEDKTTNFGAAYASGKFAIGASQNRFDSGTTGSDYDTTLYSATYAVSDTVSVGFHHQIAENESNSNDEKVNSFEVGYNLGALVVALNYQQATNVGNLTANDADAWTISLSQAF